MLKLIRMHELINEKQRRIVLKNILQPTVNSDTLFNRSRDRRFCYSVYNKVQICLYTHHSKVTRYGSVQWQMKIR